jgi:hypothetical protein
VPRHTELSKWNLLSPGAIFSLSWHCGQETLVLYRARGNCKGVEKPVFPRAFGEDARSHVGRTVRSRPNSAWLSIDAGALDALVMYITRGLENHVSGADIVLSDEPQEVGRQD